jgi:hypothetical protein
MAFFGNKRKDFSIQPPKQQVDATPFFVTDSANIDFTLLNLNLTANLTQLLPTSGTYGSSTLIPILQIDQFGRITGVTTTTFSASGIELQTNSETNDTQDKLNLIGGVNTEITDDTFGNITIDTKPVSLPVPKVRLQGERYDIEWIDYNNNAPGDSLLTIINKPHVIAMDIGQDILDEYRVFVEMVYYRKGRKTYVAHTPQSVVGGVATNTLQQTLGAFPLMTRGGVQKIRFIDLNINRPNHYEVTSQNQRIEVSDYFNGMFTQQEVYYYTTEGNNDILSTLCTIPAPKRESNNQISYGIGYIGKGRFAYQSTYQPLYIAFRYIAFDPKGNNGKGRFISGPLSKVVTVSNERFPFVPQPKFNALHGYATCIPNEDYKLNVLKCWFENRLP